MEKKKGFCYRSQYGIVVVCKDEAEQMKIYERLKKEGLTLKVVCV